MGHIDLLEFIECYEAWELFAVSIDVGLRLGSFSAYRCLKLF